MAKRRGFHIVVQVLVGVTLRANEHSFVDLTSKNGKFGSSAGKIFEKRERFEASDAIIV
jgi:hypothetical protein